MMNDDTNILSVEDENTPTFHFHVVCVSSTFEAALVDAARRGERGVFGQRRAVLHGAGFSSVMSAASFGISRVWRGFLVH